MIEENELISEEIEHSETIIVSDEQQGIRIDKLLGDEFDEYSRSFVQKLIKDGLVFVNEKVIKSNYKCALGDKIQMFLPEPLEENLIAEEMHLEVLYEDDDIIVINKPKGMVVHPAPGHASRTLVNGLLFHCKDSLSGINGLKRPGIVHRIDMDTTGSLIVCKNDISHREIALQLKNHTIVRKYRAIVHGSFQEIDGTVHAAIGRHPVDRKKMSIHAKHTKDAITHYHVLESFPGYSYIECQLETGRTHQIRVHMASIGHPLVGDTLYGIKERKFLHTDGQCLHAMTLGFVHPKSKEYIEIQAPIPEYFDKILYSLRNS